MTLNEAYDRMLLLVTPWRSASIAARRDHGQTLFSLLFVMLGAPG